MKAFLKNYRQSPRKVRLIADLIRGKKVDEAEAVLDFTAKRAADRFKKLLTSAVANAKQNFGVEKDNLYIKEVQVNKGVTMHRWRPVWRGMAHPINKRSCHITLILAEQELKNKETKKQKNKETKIEKIKTKAVKPVKKTTKTASVKGKTISGGEKLKKTIKKTVAKPGIKAKAKNRSH